MVHSLSKQWSTPVRLLRSACAHCKVHTSSPSYNPVVREIKFPKSGGEIKLFMEQYEKNRDSKLFQALADTVMRANWKEVEEEGNMSDVIKEIFADQFHKCEAEARAQGEAEGRAEGAASKMNEQIMKKYKKGCSVAETADMLEENPSVIEQIYDILRQNAPDYDVQKIYQSLLKKNTQDSLT